MHSAKLEKRNTRDGLLLVAPLVLGCLVFFALPFVLVLLHAVMNGVGQAREFVGLGNFRDMLGNQVFRLAFGNTMKFLAVGLPLIMVLAMAIALLLKNQASRHELLKSVLMLPYIMPVVGTVLLVELLFTETGLLNRGLYTLGLPVEDWLHSEAAFAIGVGVYLWKNTGYSVILLLSGLVTIPQEQYAAASLDGANGWQQLWHITIPQLWNTLFFTAVFSLINAFKCFREIFLIGGTHPHTSIYMLQHFINNAFEKLNFPKLAVASVLLLAVLVTVFALEYSWVTGKEAYKE